MAKSEPRDEESDQTIPSQLPTEVDSGIQQMYEEQPDLPRLLIATYISKDKLPKDLKPMYVIKPVDNDHRVVVVWEDGLIIGHFTVSEEFAGFLPGLMMTLYHLGQAHGAEKAMTMVEAQYALLPLLDGKGNKLSMRQSE